MIRGKTREAPMAQKMDIPELDTPTIEASIYNRFDIEVIDAATGEVKQEAFAENLILNQLWNRVGQQWFSYIHYGTGTGTLAATRTSLFNNIGSGDVRGQSASMTFDTVTGVYTLKRAIQLSETTAVGQTLTEVGIGSDTSAGSLVTHAMLKDMNGNQISIAKTATDIINIYATVFVHFNPAGYSNGSVKFLSGASTTCDVS